MHKRSMAISCRVCINVPPKNVVILRVEDDVVLVNVDEEFVGTKDFRDLDELVIVVVSVEERLLPEDL
jgi:hypothetical protein